jgi:hypothetical protein
MPLRLYDNNDWRSPTSIRIYDNSDWQTAKVGYVYDLGVWKVVFPDPIIPLVNVIDNGSWAEVNTVDRFYVQMILNTSELESMVGELYSGSTATGTPIQTQNFDYSFIFEGYEYYIRFYVPSPGTYTIKATATSITENSVSVVSNPISPIALSVNITSANITTTSYSVTWDAVGQEEYTIYANPVNPGPSGNTFEQGVSATKRAASGGISPPLAGSTPYRVTVGIRRSGQFLYTTSEVIRTTPAGYNPQITNFSATSTCNSITATWTNNADIDNGVISISEAVEFQQGMPIFGNTQNFNFVSPQNSKSFISLTPYGYLNSPTAGIYRIEIFGRSLDNTETPVQTIDINTLPASITNVPSFSATSSTYGESATLNWTHATANCTTRTGYTIQYKLASSSTWSLVSNQIMANVTSLNISSQGIVLTANTAYNFRIFARSDAGNSPDYTYADLTTNNTPYSITLFSEPTETTFSSISMTAYLVNISGSSVPLSGVTINFSAQETGRGSFSATSVSTNSLGQASTTFNTNATNGPINFTASSSGLVSGTDFTLVSLSNPLIPSLSVLNRNAFGVDISHSNYNSSWSYTSSVSGTGFIWPGQTVASTQFLLYIQTQNNSAPSASQDANNVYCTSGSWTFAPSVSVTVNSSRTGYTNGSASISSSPIGGFSQNYTYTWYYYDGSAWQLWGAGDPANNGRRGKGTFYASNIKGKAILCTVEATRNYSGTLYGANSANSNKITGS